MTLGLSSGPISVCMLAFGLTGCQSSGESDSGDSGQGSGAGTSNLSDCRGADALRSATVARFSKLTGNCPELPDVAVETGEEGSSSACSSDVDKNACTARICCVSGAQSSNSFCMDLDVDSTPPSGKAEFIIQDVTEYSDVDAPCRSTYSVVYE